MSTLAPWSPPSKTHPSPQARTLRLWFDITDDHGITNRYAVAPVPAAAPDLAFRLTKYYGSSPQASYLAWQDSSGKLSCNCKGFVGHRHCKHVSCLLAAGLFPPAPPPPVRPVGPTCCI